MLTNLEYTNFRNGFAGHYDNLPLAPTYNDYVQYETLWENYILNAAAILLAGPTISRIGLIAMESAPGTTNHPHLNYIFHNTQNIIGANGTNSDSYIRNIYNGAHINYGLYHNGLTKQQCLDGLLHQNDVLNNQRPIILFDLFPTHGISLGPIDRVFLNNGILPEIQIEINNKLNFIFNNLLLPLGLNWGNVHVNFACPPLSIVVNNNYPNGQVLNYIGHYIPNNQIHPISINTIGNGVAPNQNDLRANITHHGF
jgi:hypothetical protein